MMHAGIDERGGWHKRFEALPFTEETNSVAGQLQVRAAPTLIHGHQMRRDFRRIECDREQNTILFELGFRFRSYYRVPKKIKPRDLVGGLVGERDGMEERAKEAASFGSRLA